MKGLTPSRIERLLTTPYTLTEDEAKALLAQPSPYTVDLYGLRLRRADEPAYRTVSFEEFEQRAKARRIEAARASRRVA